MSVNRYFNRRPYEGSFYTPPVDLIASQLDFAQKKYDENYAIANQISLQFIDSLPQDRQAANELQDRYSKTVDDIVKQYNGDFSKAGRGLNDFLYNLKKEYNPGGKAHAIVTRKQKWDSWLGRQQERVGKELTGDQLSSAYNYYFNNIEPIGEKDPITGAYAEISMYMIYLPTQMLTKFIRMYLASVNLLSLNKVLLLLTRMDMMYITK